MNLGQFIDHTLLKPEATPAQIAQLCREAITHNFAAVCVNGVYVAQSSSELKESQVAVCTVVGFPLGASTTIAKCRETEELVKLGAKEIDMVLWVGGLKGALYREVETDIRAVRSLSPLLKVIIETSLLIEEEKITACKIAENAGADFVKTSTGFSSGGATLADVKLMRATVSSAVKIKASGGIRERQFAEELIAAGADRLGTSASVTLVSKGPVGK